MKKYALIQDNIEIAGTIYNNVVVQTENKMREGLVEVPLNVKGQMVKKEDGTFDYPQSIKDLIQAEKDAQITKENAKASGNQKLLDLGLSQAEATALTGYTPPVEE